MKNYVFILLMLVSSAVSAQQIHGFVYDKVSGTPIPNATVRKGKAVAAASYYDGYFNISSAHFGDTIKVTSVGYKPFQTVIGMRYPDTLRVYMEPSSIILNNVDVNARRDVKQDSVNIRKEFSRMFAYKGPAFYDAFVTYNPYEYRPNNYIMATNSTTSLVGIDIGSVVGLFTKNKSADAKLRERLLKDEQTSYAERRFSKQKITAITQLQGDELQSYIEQYRPSVEQLKAMSDYDILVYIKKSYADLLRIKQQEKKK